MLKRCYRVVRNGGQQKACEIPSGRSTTTDWDAPSVLRRIALALGLADLLGRGARALALEADGSDQALDVGALGDGLALLFKLAGDHVLPHVVILRKIKKPPNRASPVEIEPKPALQISVDPSRNKTRLRFFLWSADRTQGFQHNG